MFKSMSHDRQQAIHLHGIFKTFIKLLIWVRIALLFKTLPLGRLGCFHKPNQCMNIQRNTGR